MAKRGRRPFSVETCCWGGGKSIYLSLLRKVLLREQDPAMESLLQRNPLIGEEEHSNEIQTKPTPLITPTKPSARKFTYKPLNFDRNEIRLLTLLQPVDGGSTNIVMCRMEHFSLSDLIPEYAQYLDALDNEGTTGQQYHDGWFQHTSETGDKTTTTENRRARPRFEWGDFTDSEPNLSVLGSWRGRDGVGFSRRVLLGCFKG
jgi:hypothetical protein